MRKYTRNPGSRHVSQSQPLKTQTPRQISMPHQQFLHPSQGRRLVHVVSDVELIFLEMSMSDPTWNAQKREMLTWQVRHVPSKLSLLE